MFAPGKTSMPGPATPAIVGLQHVQNRVSSCRVSHWNEAGMAKKTRPPAALVGIIMGSKSDQPTMQHAADTLEELEVAYEMRIVSAHRTPELMVAYAKEAEQRGLEVIIAGAGGAAHLPGMTAALTVLPVLGVPIQSAALSGIDSLLSIVQMPGGVPVGTLAIGKAGAINAALLAAEILGAKYPGVREKVRAYREANTRKVMGETRDDIPF
jgi:5-(carboxyamino)imidazole ribonucleotide mutase